MCRTVITILFFVCLISYINAEAFPGPAEHLDNTITVTDSGVEVDQVINLKNYYDESFDSYNVYVFEDGFDVRQLRDLKIEVGGNSATPIIENLTVAIKLKNEFLPNETATIKLHFKSTSTNFRTDKQILNIFGLRIRCGGIFGDWVNCYPLDEYLYGSTDVKKGDMVEFIQVTKHIDGKLVSSFGNLPISQCYIYKAADGFSVNTETKNYRKFCTDKPFAVWDGNKVTMPVFNTPEEAIIEQKDDAAPQVSFCIKEQCILGKENRTDIWFMTVSYTRQILHKIIFLIILILGLVGIKLANDYSPLEHLLTIYIPLVTIYLSLFMQPRPSTLTIVDVLFFIIITIGVVTYGIRRKEHSNVDGKMYG